MSFKIETFSTIDYHISAKECELRRLKQKLSSARFLLAEYEMEFFEWSFAINQMTNSEYTPSLVKDKVKIPLVNFGGAKFYLATCQITVEILELHRLPFINESDYLELEKMELSTLKHLALFVNQSQENRDNFHKSFDQHGMFEFTESDYYEEFKDFEETILEQEKLDKTLIKVATTKKPTMKI